MNDISTSSIPERDFVGYEALVEFAENRGLHELEGDLVEIGVFMGGGTAKLARFADNHGKKVFAIDVFDIRRDTSRGPGGLRMCEIYEALLQGRSQLEVYQDSTQGYSNVVTIASDSRKVSFDEDQKFVFGFIDGNHRPAHVRNDFYLVWRHLVPGGTIAFHDYGELRGVTSTVNGLTKRHMDEIDSIDKIEDKNIILITRKSH